MNDAELERLLDGRKSINVYSFTYDEEEEHYIVITTNMEKQIIDQVDVYLIVPFGPFNIFIFEK